MNNIWTNGCFDVIHRGHIDSLKFAKSLGDHLVVGVDTDERVRAAKGESRPYNTLSDRVAVLESIKYVDEIRVFDSDESLVSIIKEISPTCFVKGSEYRGKKIIGSEYAAAIVYFDLRQGYSTTKTLNKIYGTER